MTTPTTLPVIGYAFRYAEMLMIPTIQGQSNYACGCFTGVYLGEPIGTLDPHPEAIGRHSVFFNIELSTRLTEAEYQALLLHEEGHVALGHIERLQAGEAQASQFELEADRYAIEHGACPMALLSGMEKSLQLASERFTLFKRARKLRAALIRWFAHHSNEYKLRVRQLHAFR